MSADGTSAPGEVDAGFLRVTLSENYYWPDPVTIQGANGRQVEVEVFPLVTALVVERRDGRPLGPGDEAASREAAGAYCAGRGERFADGSASRLSDGAWAFTPCAPRAD